MQLKLIVLFLCPFVLIGCKGSETGQKVTSTDAVRNEHASPTPTAATPQTQQPSTATTASPAAKPKLDACAMLTSQDIESVQGEALKETKLSEKSAEGFLTSQCFFTLPTFTNSISLAVTQKADGPGGRDPRKFWNDAFHRDKERDRDEREEEEKEKSPPQKITGIGDEAFWIASPAAGVLYVLKGPSYVRISIGGQPADQQTRIKKSKALAQKVLARL